MTDSKNSLPDRLSLNPRSEYFDDAILSRGVGIRFNGVEKTNVIEYSVSEGWICVPAGRSLDRYGQPMTVKLKGVVEPYYDRSLGDGEAHAEDAAEDVTGDSGEQDEKGPGANTEA